MKSKLKYLLLATILFACNTTTDINYIVEINTLNNMGIKEAISKANEWRVSLPKIKSYVTTEELVVEFPDGREVHKNLPDNEMYIAIAPYVNFTHSCSTHYISTCKAELSNKVLQVIATGANENIIINDKYTAMDNGFIELWLPRNRTININIIYGSLSSSETIITNKDSRTCLTTFKLDE
ncbi:MAG: CueP family metal-binding protein [bacterium]